MRAVQLFVGSLAARLPLARADPEPPDVVAGVDRRVGVVDDVAELVLRLTELPGRRAAQLHARQAGRHHVVRMPAVHHRDAPPLDHERRLLVALHAADRLHRGRSPQRFLDQLDRDLALLDVADVAVVQRVEVRDVEQVLDQQDVVRRHVHRIEHVRLPGRAAQLRRARRLHLADLRRIAGPDPHQAVLLDRRERPQLGLGRDRQVELRGDAYALARGLVAEAVIGAFEHAVREHATFREAACACARSGRRRLRPCRRACARRAPAGCRSSGPAAGRRGSPGSGRRRTRRSRQTCPRA